MLVLFVTCQPNHQVRHMKSSTFEPGLSFQNISHVVLNFLNLFVSLLSFYYTQSVRGATIKALTKSSTFALKLRTKKKRKENGEHAVIQWLFVVHFFKN